jgi:hypothetical protein
LATAADGDLLNIPLWPGGYLPEAIQAAVTEAAPDCHVALQGHPDGSWLLSASVPPEHRSASRPILGEILNHALMASARQLLNENGDVR